MNKTWQRALLAGTCALVACQTQQNQNEQENSEGNRPAPLHLGAVHQVFPDQGFATIRFIGPVPPAGSTLITHPPDGSNSRIGNLQLPQDRLVRNSYVVANIRSGIVFQGDRVFLYRNIGQAAPTPGASPDSGAITGDGSQPGTPDAGSLGAAAQVPANTAQPGTAAAPAGDPYRIPAATTTAPLQPLPAHQQEESPKQPAAVQPIRKSGNSSIPDYLNEIPDDLNDWD